MSSLGRRLFCAQVVFLATLVSPLYFVRPDLEIRVMNTVVLPGDPKSEVQTPSLCLDLDSFEANLQRTASAVRAAGKQWRPNSKSHQSLDIAKRLIHAGAIGLTCGCVADAQIFATQSIRDLLITQLPVGNRRIRQLAELCKIADPIATCDHYVQAEALSQECQRQGVRCRALVEINVGLERTGARPGRDTIELGRGIDRLPGLILSGIMGIEGNRVPGESIEDIDRKMSAASGILAHSRDIFLQNGLCCGIVSGVGTDSFSQGLRSESLTEIQAGSILFRDEPTSKPASRHDAPPTLTLLSTVISRPGFERAVLDAGTDWLAAGTATPTIKDWPDAHVLRQYAEHLVLELGPSSRELRIGDQVELTIPHPAATVALHRQFLGFRHHQLEAVWPIFTRGFSG